MRVLIAHNRYRPQAPSGENGVVDQESAALRESGHDVELFQRHSGDIANWSLPRRVTLPARVVWSEEARRGLGAEIARFRPDVVHLHNTFPLITGSALRACRSAGVPVVATIHNYKLGCASGELFREGRVCHDCLGHLPLPALAHGCYRGSPLQTLPVVVARGVHAHAWRSMVSAYVFVSAAQRDLLAPLGLPPERRFVKHNFVPTPEVHVAKEHLVAMVGRLDPAKGIPFLMDAWDRFRARRPGSGLRLVMVGGGLLGPEVSAWAATRPSVTDAGYVPREEAARILGQARAALLPSQWEETFGLVAVEAMASGTAPVASAHGSFPELVTPGRDGALFPPTDPQALVGLLEDVDDHPERWDGYGIQARQTYLNRFSPKVNIEQLLDIYRFAQDNPV